MESLLNSPWNIHSLFPSLAASLATSTLFRSMTLEPGLLLGPKLAGVACPTEQAPLCLTTVSIRKLPGRVSDWPNLGHMVTPRLERGPGSQVTW